MERLARLLVSLLLGHDRPIRKRVAFKELVFTLMLPNDSVVLVLENYVSDWGTKKLSTT